MAKEMKKQKSSKNKNNWVTVSVISFIVLIIIFLGYAMTHPGFGMKTESNSSTDSEHYPDKDGFNRKVLEGDNFESFFPKAYKEGFYYVSPNESGVIDTANPDIDGKHYIEYRENVSINITEAGKIKLQQNRRAFYAINGTYTPMAFKIWVEQMQTNEDYDNYSGFIEKSAEKTDSPKSSYKNHEYYWNMRNNLTYEYLKNKKTVGVAYVLFPEKNLVVSIDFFNTKYAPNAYLITEEQIKSISKQLIDSVLS